MPSSPKEIVTPDPNELLKNFLVSMLQVQKNRRSTTTEFSKTLPSFRTDESRAVGGPSVIPLDAFGHRWFYPRIVLMEFLRMSEYEFWCPRRPRHSKPVKLSKSRLTVPSDGGRASLSMSGAKYRESVAFAGTTRGICGKILKRG